MDEAAVCDRRSSAAAAAASSGESLAVSGSLTQKKKSEKRGGIFRNIPPDRGRTRGYPTVTRNPILVEYFPNEHCYTY